MLPLEFQPLLKRLRWGGTRLGTVLGKEIGAATDAAESWEIADHGENQSVVRGGALSGWTLNRLVREKGRELLGRNAGLEQFPLLIKFLDASDRLSVQVHPTDEQARAADPNVRGKTEAWVILDADPGSCIYAGLKPGVDRAQLIDALEQGTVEDFLHALPVHCGDCLYLPAGTVHAIGEGILLAEIQQTSDITYRLYDWGRLDREGRPRALHVDQALHCVDYKRGPINPVMPLQIESPPQSLEELVRCEYFILRRHVLSESKILEREDRFHVLLTLSGEGTLECSGDRLKLTAGQTVLIPAVAPEIELHPETELTLLETYLP